MEENRLPQTADTSGIEVLKLPLPRVIFRRAQSVPGRVLFEQVGGGTVTYAGFLERIGGFIATLEAEGVARDDRIALMVPQSVEAHVAWQAIAWLGAWDVPINNEFHGEMLAYVLNNSKARIVVTMSEFLPAFVAIQDRLEHLETLILLDDPGSEVRTHRLTIVRHRPGGPVSGTIAREPELEASDVATVIYTSGTTGPSKGVVVPWGELYTAFGIYGCRRDGRDAMYTPFPINHLSGKVPVFLMACFAGRAVLRRRFSTHEFWSDVREYGCTTTILLGGTASFLINQPASADDRNHAMRNVVMVPVVEAYKEFEARFSLPVMTIYGMSECGFPFVSPPESLANAASCGRLRETWHVRIIDGEGRDVPVGKAGELLVRCDTPHSVLREYLDNPEATAKARKDGWFHTGDAFRCDADGNYYFVDRLKDAIRRRGENISSFEVESFLTRYPGVAECAAVAVPSETGEDEIKVVITQAPGGQVDLNDLAAFCEREMPRFMVPRYFQLKSALPYTPTNKVRKAVLREEGMASGVWDRLAHRTNRKSSPQGAIQGASNAQ